jgi:zinc transporter 5/7
MLLINYSFVFCFVNFFCSLSVLQKFDCTALGIGLYASFVSKLKPNQLYTYGYGRYEILSGYVNAVFLLFIGYFILVESIERLFRPPEITSDSLVLVSFLGLCVNIVGLIFFHDHAHHGHSHAGPGGGHGHAPASGAPANSSAHEDHGHSHGGSACGGHDHGAAPVANAAADAQRNSNMVAIYLHVLADTLGSVGVIISSLMVKHWGWTSADAVCSIIISVLIIGSVLPLIRSTLDTLNQRTPIFKEQVIRTALRRMTDELPENGGIQGIIGYRHVHFWAFSDSETVGTLHVQVAEGADEQSILARLSELWKESGAAVANLTIQIEKESFIQQTEAHQQKTNMLTGGNM